MRARGTPASPYRARFGDAATEEHDRRRARRKGYDLMGRLREYVRRSAPGEEAWGRHHRGQRRGAGAVRLARYALGGGLVLLALALLVGRQAFDLPIMQALQGAGSPALYRVMVAVSWLGWQPQVTLLSVPLVLLLFARGLIPESAAALLALLLGSPVYLLLAILGDRPRPYVVVEGLPVYRELTGTSFPSGHVINYVLFCGFLAYLTYTLVRHPAARRALLVPTLGLIALVGPSRIYLGQHWPSDVLASYLIGGVLLLALVALYRRAKRRQLALAALLEGTPARAQGAGEGGDGQRQ